MLAEAAAVACVKLCKIATYISTSDSNNVVFVLIHTIISDLKVSYGRSGAGVETLQTVGTQAGAETLATNYITPSFRTQQWQCASS